MTDPSSPGGNRPDKRMQTRMLGLMDACTLINSSLELDDVLESILGLAVAITEATASSIFLRDKETGDLMFQAQVGGGNPEALKELKVPLEGSIAGWVATHGEPVRLDDATQDDRFFARADALSQFQTRSMLAVPLKTRQDVVGVVQVLNKRGDRAFDSDDELLLTAMANEAGAAIETRRAYERLSHEKATIETIVDRIPDGILVTDRDGRPRTLNAAAREIFGIATGEFSSESLEVFLRGLKDVNSEASQELVLLKPQGRVFSCRISPVRTEDGEVQSIVTAIRDVTSARKWQRRRDEFFAVGVHALVYPMERAMKLVQSGDSDAAASTLVQLSEVVTELVRFSEMESGPIRLLRREEPLVDILRGATEGGLPRGAGGKQGEIDWHAPGPELLAYVDVSQIQQALSLLLDSAAFLLDDRCALEIRSGANEERQIVTTLSGTSHRPEAREAATWLDAQARVEHFLENPGATSELGPAFARHIIESHGGSLQYSHSGDRFCFEMVLPPCPDSGEGSS